MHRQTPRCVTTLLTLHCLAIGPARAIRRSARGRPAATTKPVQRGRLAPPTPARKARTAKTCGTEVGQHWVSSPPLQHVEFPGGHLDVNILIIGGTRNLGHFLTLSLVSRGHCVTLLNRGQTRDDLPAGIPRLRADRCDEAQLRGALVGREFDAVVDTALYRGREAREVVDVLDGRVGRFVFISTGQVYLVRTGAARPFSEEAYSGALMAEPQGSSSDLNDWRYGIEKREAEDVLAEAWERRCFPVTSLRLPMVASERDHYSRIHGYLLRLRDGGPLLLPRPPWLGVRHVDVHDVVAAIERLLASSAGLGRTYNVSPDETLTLGAFLDLLATIACVPKRTVLVDRALLESRALLPACSPMSDAWMSELDNARGRSELGLSYTRVAETLRRIVAHYDAHPGPSPASYGRRAEELALAKEAGCPNASA